MTCLPRFGLRRAWLPLIGAVGLAVVGCSQSKVRPVSRPASAATLLISSNLWGYLEPCGCSENMRGGLARAAQQIADARQSGAQVLFIDAGDALFGHPALSESLKSQGGKKARTLATSLLKMGLATRAIGELDDALGPGFRQSLRLPEQRSGTAQLFEVGGQKLAVAVGADGPQLQVAASAARANGARFVLGILHRSLAESEELEQTAPPQVDLLVAAHAEGELGAEENRLVRGKVPAVQLQSKGRSLLRVDIAWGPAPGPFELLRTEADAQRDLAAFDQRILLLEKQLNAPGLQEQTKPLYRAKIAELVQRRHALASAPLAHGEFQNALAVRFVPLEASLPNEPGVAALLEAYHRQVAALNLRWALEHGEDCPPASPGHAAVVGNAACRECHADAFPVWEKSKHGSAYATLVQAGRQYDLECVGCHVTGIDQPGGVCRVDRVEGRQGVGCEDCHSNGSVHRDDPTAANIRAKPRREDCVGCHNPENSPHFDFASYLPQILGPGHSGQKAKRP